jgi:hypothetical protein
MKGVLVLTLLLVMTLGSGTALASRQSGVAPQEALTRLDGATIVADKNCTLNDTGVTVWGSGFRANEIVILSVIKDEDTSIIWSTGNANASGALAITKTLVTKPPSATSDKARWPGAGLYTIEAVGVSGRLTTTPLVFADEKCS